MPSTTISSIDVAALVNELQFLQKGKISQIYHQDKQELLLQLHAVGKGKQLLKIIPGKYLCLTQNKDTPLKPTSFCMQLRKYLANAFIKDFHQKDSERIVVFELEKQETYFLVIELFSKGNIILLDHQHNIITALERQIWKDRIVKPGVQYTFPQSAINWKILTKQLLLDIFRKSTKKNIAISLATEIGLGGWYAEDICARNQIKKEINPSEVSEEEIEQIHNSVNSIVTLIKNPKGYVYEDHITPFPLYQKPIIQTHSTFSHALDALNPFRIISPYEKKINALQRRIQEQEEIISQLQEKIISNTRKGEVLYENYQPLQKLQQIIAALRQNHDWSIIEKELKREKRIKNIDLKTKKILISFH